jgi:hypothetical protein
VQLPPGVFLVDGAYISNINGGITETLEAKENGERKLVVLCSAQENNKSGWTDNEQYRYTDLHLLP